MTPLAEAEDEPRVVRDANDLLIAPLCPVCTRREQRTFDRFSDLTNEVLEARIWAGIHFRNPDVQAAHLGREVERYIHTHFFAAAH